MADSPVTATSNIVTFEITSEGTKLKDYYQVQTIRIRKNLNKIPTATIVFFDGSPADQEFDISDSSDLIPGKEIEIKAGYDFDNTSIFKGVVVNHGIMIGEGQPSKLEVEIKDKAYKMTIGRKNAYFEEKKDSDVITSLLSDAGLTADVEATTIEHPMLVQHYSSDWDFMMSRADINGKVAIVDAAKVTVCAPKTSEEAVLTVTYGSDLMSYNVELNAGTQLSAAKGTSWDMATQSIVQNEADSPTVNTQGNIASSKLAEVFSVTDFGLQSAGAIDSEVLKSWSSAQLLKSWMNKITGEASFQGSNMAVPGCIIEFKGVGSRFNGNAFISGVEHDISEGDWITTVQIGLTNNWYTETPDIEAPHASGLLPSIQGLTIGVVKQLESDPDNEFRIQISMPLMQDDDSGVWARLSNFYATNGAGTFFIPEIGDEVVVGFLNDDPRYPIILGSLYSSKNKVGKDVEGNDLALTDDNYTKAFQTKALNKIEFDDENKIITITTPGKNKVVFDDKEKSITVQDLNENKILLNTDGISLEDKNSNKIVMDSSGIEINSPKNIKLVAMQDISASATANVDVSATQNVSVSGLEISNAADISFSATGNATAELSASGQTTVKGAIVMIN